MSEELEPQSNIINNIGLHTTQVILDYTTNIGLWLLKTVQY